MLARSSSLLTCTIDRFEGQKAVLRFTFNTHYRSELVLPKNLLPKGNKQGDILLVEFLTDKQATLRQKNLARAILKEILGGE